MEACCVQGSRGLGAGEIPSHVRCSFVCGQSKPLHLRASVPQTFHLQALGAVRKAYVCVTTTAGEAVDHVTSTAGSVVAYMHSTAGNAFTSVKGTAVNTVNGLKVRVPPVCGTFDLYLFYGIIRSLRPLNIWRVCCTVQLKQGLHCCKATTGR